LINTQKAPHQPKFRVNYYDNITIHDRFISNYVLRSSVFLY
jgi:hypothetical protein